MNTEDLTVLYGFYGKGLYMGVTRGEKAKREYTIPVPAGYSSAKFLAYCPGYQVAYISETTLDKPWSPEFKKLTTTPMEGIVTDTRNKPISSKKLVLVYLMHEAMPFFGYADGAVSRFAVATINTKSDGTFRTEIPLMETDPFFQTYITKDRRLHILLPRTGNLSAELWTTQPETISVQAKYTGPVRIQVIKKAKLSGQIEKSFLNKNKVVGEAKTGFWPETEIGNRITLDARTTEGNHSYNCMLNSNYSFSVFLPPGKYDIVLNILKRGYVLDGRIVVNKDLMLKEADDTRLVLK